MGCHPREGGDPVRRGVSVLSSASLGYWIARRSLSSGGHSADPVAGDDTDVCSRSRGAMRPKFCKKTLPSKSEGAGKTGCALHPRSRRHDAQGKCAHEHTGSAVNTPASPTQRLYGLYEFALVTGFLATIIGRDFSLYTT